MGRNDRVKNDDEHGSSKKWYSSPSLTVHNSQRTQGFSSSTVSFSNWFLRAPINPTLHHLDRQNPLMIYESCIDDLKLQYAGGYL
ncbi:unnamed protein product [Lactuca virosa]|uniref:Uncharacterized protein n=1 Tax=Lactuca virosa TaxID=75947 RepID=A0AAU9LJT6_9ASTR|nr:unnamed protein product [Lactuca virosa]